MQSKQIQLAAEEASRDDKPQDEDGHGDADDNSLLSTSKSCYLSAAAACGDCWSSTSQSRQPKVDQVGSRQVSAERCHNCAVAIPLVAILGSKQVNGFLQLAKRPTTNQTHHSQLEPDAYHSARSAPNPLELPQNDALCPHNNLAKLQTVCDQVSFYPADIILQKLNSVEHHLSRMEGGDYRAPFNFDSLFSDERQNWLDPFRDSPPPSQVVVEPNIYQPISSSQDDGYYSAPTSNELAKPQDDHQKWATFEARLVSGGGSIKTDDDRLSTSRVNIGLDDDDNLFAAGQVSKSHWGPAGLHQREPSSEAAMKRPRRQVRVRVTSGDPLGSLSDTPTGSPAVTEGSNDQPSSGLEQLQSDTIGAPPNQAPTEIQEQPICRANSIYISPRAALSDKKQWKYIVNLPERDPRVRQIIRVDICQDPLGPCSDQVSVPFGFISQCKQKFTKKKLLAIDSQSGLLEVETFLIPSCCVCQLLPDTSGGRLEAPASRPEADDEEEEQNSGREDTNNQPTLVTDDSSRFEASERIGITGSLEQPTTTTTRPSRRRIAPSLRPKQHLGTKSRVDRTSV